MADVVDLHMEKRIAEADAQRSARIWTPRDVLVKALRDLDNGSLEVTALAVVWMNKGADDIKGGYYISASDVLDSIYLTERFKKDIWDDAEA